MTPLESLEPGQRVIVGGDRVVTVSDELAAAFAPGDALFVTSLGELVHVPAGPRNAAATAVDGAVTAFSRMATVTDEQISTFFLAFADALADDRTFAPIAAANADDVALARSLGQSTVRLVLSETMRDDMIAGLRGWAHLTTHEEPLSTIPHAQGWEVTLHKAPLGVVGFVFEGRPNVFADACGVLRTGNTVVFRIGSAALGTARAVLKYALEPAIQAAGLPAGCVGLVDSATREAGYALVSDDRLGLVVVRGSGRAVRMLGDVARSAGNQVSLHGRGGAWMLIAPGADPERVRGAIWRSLDRKVCNTLNTIVLIGQTHADAVLAGLEDAQSKAGKALKLHVHASADHLFGPQWRAEVPIARSEGDVIEPQLDAIETDAIGDEWEWEHSPEVTVVMAETAEEATTWLNTYSPAFVVSVLSDDNQEAEAIRAQVNAPFVGNDFTRWVDGQYALNEPELGLGNWELGRQIGRGALLTGAGVYTVQTRAHMDARDIHR
ncbi:aldehyde dehydrogenase family protein [Stomatohabitans albus]|uniref:aldehyde dehydrogenase family protein n=1 Tax=Stomatohabitans albus TaxID=3110766 RepID=UPI00300C3BC8